MALGTCEEEEGPGKATQLGREAARARGAVRGAHLLRLGVVAGR